MSSSLLHQCKQTDNQSMVSAPRWIRTVTTALRGIATHHEWHIRPHGNFMYSGVFPLEPDIWNEYVVSIMIVLINEWWIHPPSFPHKCGFSSYVSKDDFIPEKTQERKGFIYDDCWWLSLFCSRNHSSESGYWFYLRDLSSMNDESSLINPLSFPLDCHGEDVLRFH